MSEYQYVYFIACDKPLDEKQLAYMRKQSSRAEITRWDFTNEYHFGDFRGNAAEMLRHGYDVHLHYASFGIRKLMFRLPGLPWDKKTLASYMPESGVTFHKDKIGPGVILEIDPESDAGTFYEQMIDLDPLLEVISQVRGLLISGDLRSLYVIWLAMNHLQGYEEAMEPPIPAGLSDLLAAAAEVSPPLGTSAAPNADMNAWLASQSKDDLKELVHRFLTEEPISIRTEILARIRNDVGAATWPTVTPSRTLQQLRELSDEIEIRRTIKETAAKEKAKLARLKKIAANPQKVIDDVEMLVSHRSSTSYAKAAKALVELSEALGPIDGPAKVQAVAESLREKYPTGRTLLNTLKKFGLLPKK